MATSLVDLTQWVENIYEGWGETGISISRGVSWLQNNLYRLNTALTTSFTTTSSGTIEPGLNSFESGIYTEMYFCDYLNKKANQALGAMAYDWTEMDMAEMGTIRKVSRNETAKTYRSMSNDCEKRLTELITWYLRSLSSYSPAYSINYSDRGTVPDWGLLQFNAPPTHLYSENNMIFNRSTDTE